MKATKTAGFTIIEVTLFLGISGLMAVLLLVGAGFAIQREQYRESVVSYQAFLKDQYSKVVNVENDRQAGSVCSEGRATNRGQARCVIVGRYVASDDAHGRQYQSMPVYAIPDASGDFYSYRIDTSKRESYGTQWSVQTRQSTQAEGSSKVAILMYRHPQTGALNVKASSQEITNGSIDDIVAQPPKQQAQEICVFDTNWFTGSRQSVFIDSKVSASEAFHAGAASEACNEG